MDYIITNPDGTLLSVIQHCSLDLAYGSGENDFELTIEDEQTKTITGGCLLINEGTDYGGIVDSITVDNGTIVYKGRTWHGILANKIIQPSLGNDYYTATGAFRNVATQLINKLNLNSYFEADMTCDKTVNTYQFARYVDAYTGLLDMCQANNLTLTLRYNSERKKIIISARGIRTVNNLNAGNTIATTITQTFNRVNHLIGLGKGELRNRAVSHWYASSEGIISRTQSLTGIQENALVYDNNNAEAAELDDLTRKKLAEYQNLGTIQADMSTSDLQLDIGDKVTAISKTANISATNYVTKKIITVDNDQTTVQYTVDQSLHDQTTNY